jgi:glucose uptake protein GlcU
MRLDDLRGLSAPRAGMLLLALGLMIAPWALEFRDDAIAAWSAWSLSGLYAIIAAASARANPLSAGTMLLAAGLWTLLAPGMLGFDLTNPSGFWTHTVAGLLALRISYDLFQSADPGGMQTG